MTPNVSFPAGLSSNFHEEDSLRHYIELLESGVYPNAIEMMMILSQISHEMTPDGISCPDCVRGGNNNNSLQCSL